MNSSHKILACVLTGAVAFATSAAAVPDRVPVSAEQHMSSGLRAVSTNSDADIAQLLLTGTGPAANAHPSVVKLLGFDRIKGRAPEPKIRAFVSAFLKGTPTFHRDVVAKIQSGDPYQTRAALGNITNELQTFLNTNNVHVYHADNSKMMSPDGWWWTVTNGGVAVNVGAVVNGGLYANVAVATEVAVAAAVVWLAGVFLTYKFDPSSTDRLDHDMVVATITKDLRVA